jgi:hypothetical protein
MLELDSLGVAFELADLCTVGIHCVFDIVPLLVDLIDGDLDITVCQ